MLPISDIHQPVIIFYIIQEGVTTVDSAYTQPFHNIGPIRSSPHQELTPILPGGLELPTPHPHAKRVPLRTPASQSTIIQCRRSKEGIQCFCKRCSRDLDVQQFHFHVWGLLHAGRARNC